MPSFSIASQGKVLPETKVIRYLADSTGGDHLSLRTTPLVKAPCYSYATRIHCTLRADFSQPWHHWGHIAGGFLFHLNKEFGVSLKHT